MPAESDVPGLASPLADWLRYMDRVHPAEIALGLDRLREVAAALPALPSHWRVITVAGTNGKGSTVMAMEALLLAAGYRVGATLSPHLDRFEERIRIQGADAKPESIVAALAAVEAVRGSTPLTYFEYAALATLKVFAAQELDVVLLEIGLGGRLDAFNLLDAHTAVITSIGLDHEAWLGTGLEAIGAEKAGILRRGQRACFGPELPSSVWKQARAFELEPLAVGHSLELTETSGRWQLRCDPEGWATPPLPVGPFVTSNAALALAACWPLLESAPEDWPDLQVWAADLAMPGRREMLLAGGRRWLLDVAHNPAAATSLAQWLSTRVLADADQSTVTSPAPAVAVFGTLADKDAAGIVQALRTVVAHWILVPTQALSPRGQSTAALLASVQDAASGGASVSAVSAARDLTQGLRVARALAEPGAPVLVFGAFAVVAEARKQLQADGP